MIANALRYAFFFFECGKTRIFDFGRRGEGKGRDEWVIWGVKGAEGGRI